MFASKAPSSVSGRTNLPWQVGITGGIGSGKSVVCRALAALGVPVYDADRRARWLMNHDESLRDQLRAAFGERTFLPDGSLNRAYLAAEALPVPSQLTRLNGLVHPAVGHDYAAWVRNQGQASYVVREAALLFESGGERGLDTVLTVFAPLPLRLARVRRRDPFRTEAEILTLVANQLSEEEKMRRAEATLFNDDLTPLLPQILHWHHQWLARATHRPAD